MGEEVRVKVEVGEPVGVSVAVTKWLIVTGAWMTVVGKLVQETGKNHKRDAVNRINPLRK